MATFSHGLDRYVSGDHRTIGEEPLLGTNLQPLQHSLPGRDGSSRWIVDHQIPNKGRDAQDHQNRGLITHQPCATAMYRHRRGRGGFRVDENRRGSREIVTWGQCEVIPRGARSPDSKLRIPAGGLSSAIADIGTAGAEIDDLTLEHARTSIAAGTARALRIELATPARLPVADRLGCPGAIRRGQALHARACLRVTHVRVSEPRAVCRVTATDADVYRDVADRRLCGAPRGRARG